MEEFVNTIDVIGDDELAKTIIEGTITEFKDNIIQKLGKHALCACKNLITVNMPNVTEIGEYCFWTCEKLITCDLSSIETIEVNTFYNCYRLKAFILRNGIIPTLKHTNAFGNCYHFFGTVHNIYNKDGLKDGYFYVPKALIEDYKVETNWATFADQFRALEDYTVDGTITGELDESKI